MIEYYTDKQDKHRARIIAKNGECIFGSHQGFVSKQGAKDNLIDIAIVVINEYDGAIG